VLDAGKAIAAMLKTSGAVKDYLEGVGTQNPPGSTLPFIALPTTSGTGSEATKNAVLSEVGAQGFKKSLRHNNFVPDIALVDPELTLNCPPSITASSGMDAFTQLLESYVSTKANAMTDALAMSGLERIRKSLRKAYEDSENIAARADVAYASLLSGITLANAGLGVVHGFASSIGGFFQIPHGVVCGSLMGPANHVTLEKLRKEGNKTEVLAKYATVGKLFSKAAGKSEAYYADALITLIEEWTAIMKIPKLSAYGIGQEDVTKIVGATGNKNNPVALDQAELAAVLEARM
jgi:alcohol dehydrogenase class IV